MASLFSLAVPPPPPFILPLSGYAFYRGNNFTQFHSPPPNPPPPEIAMLVGERTPSGNAGGNVAVSTGAGHQPRQRGLGGVSFGVGLWGCFCTWKLLLSTSGHKGLVEPPAVGAVCCRGAGQCCCLRSWGRAVSENGLRQHLLTDAAPQTAAEPLGPLSPAWPLWGGHGRDGASQG